MKLVDSLANELIKIQIQNVELVQKIEATNNIYQQRFTVLYFWIGIFITLLIAIFVINWFNVRGLARQQAVEEVNKHELELEKLKQKGNEIIIELENILTSYTNEPNENSSINWWSIRSFIGHRFRDSFICNS